jgi:hypothetical protein
MEGGAVGHKFERDPPRDHPCQVRFNLVQRVQRRRFKCESLRRTTDGRTDGRQDDDGCQVMAKAHLVKGRPGELKTHGEKTMHVNVNTKVSTHVT